MQPDVYPLTYDPAQRAIQIASIAQGEDIRALVVDFATNQAFVHYGLSEVRRTVNSESLPYILSMSQIEPHDGVVGLDKADELFISAGCTYVFHNPDTRYSGSLESIVSEQVMSNYLIGVRADSTNFHVVGVSLEV